MEPSLGIAACPAWLWLCVLQEVTQQLLAEFNCHPVFLGTELKTNFYKSEQLGSGQLDSGQLGSGP